MPEGEHYEPSPEEIAKAEEIMTDEERGLSEIRESEKKACLIDFIENKMYFGESFPEEENEILIRGWNEAKLFFEQNLRGEDKEIALGLLAKSRITYQIYKTSFPTPETEGRVDFIDWLSSNFPRIVPGELLKARQEGYLNKDVTWHLWRGLDTEYAKARLKSLVSGEKMEPAMAGVPFNIRQRALPGFFHGFGIKSLEDILSDGLKSNRALSADKKRGIESAFPFSVSMSRPYPDREKSEGDWSWRANAHLETSVVTNNWGADGMQGNEDWASRPTTKLTAIIDYDYVLPRTYGTWEIYYGNYKTNYDEEQSIPSVIPADKIVGIICNYRVVNIRQDKYVEDAISDESELPEEWRDRNIYKEDPATIPEKVIEYYDNLRAGNYENTPEMVKQKDVVIEAVKKSGRDIKVYSVDGSLLWPQEEVCWKVARRFDEAVLKKLRE